MYAKGLGVKEIIDRILKDDFYDYEKMRLYFENEMKILKKVECNCEVKIADYIEFMVSAKKITHFSFTHPTPEVMLELSCRLLVSLNITENLNISCDEKFLYLDQHEEIIYPCVIKALGLNENYIFRKINPGDLDIFAGKNKLTNEEYIEKYIEICCKLLIYN